MPNIYALQEMKRTADYLICIDSDGCVFDTMEVKHKECFIPNIINYWNLQSVSKYAREAAEYVNLYSKYRGINRFPALIKVIDLLAARPEVQKRGFVPRKVAARLGRDRKRNSAIGPRKDMLPPCRTEIMHSRCSVSGSTSSIANVVGCLRFRMSASALTG